MGKGRAVVIELTDGEERELAALTRKHRAPQAMAERARIVLAAAGGLKNKEIACRLADPPGVLRFGDQQGIKPELPEPVGDDACDVPGALLIDRTSRVVCG